MPRKTVAAAVLAAERTKAVEAARTSSGPAELAAVLSAVLYESRGDSPGTPEGVDVPTGRLRRALNQTRRLWTGLRTDEQRHRISQSREPDSGFVPAIFYFIDALFEFHDAPSHRAAKGT